jgi:hypothetical protein
MYSSEAEKETVARDENVQCSLGRHGMTSPQSLSRGRVLSGWPVRIESLTGQQASYVFACPGWHSSTTSAIDHKIQVVHWRTANASRQRVHSQSGRRSRITCNV